MNQLFRSHIWSILWTTLLLNITFSGHLDAQITATFFDINPNNSSLDATNPNGASGGRVNRLGAASDGSAYYAASEWGGIYRSNDGGRNWFRLNGHIPAATWDVEVDPNNNNRIYATSFYDGRVNSFAGINVSTNGGTTWVRPASATPPQPPASNYTTANRASEPSAFGIAIDPGNTNNVYIGTNTGLAISNDAGATWRFVDPTPLTPATDIWDVIVHYNGTTATIDLVGDDGHYRSTDGGINWTTANNPVNSLPGGLSSIAVSPEESYVLFATVGARIYESLDGGGSWTLIGNPDGTGQVRIPFVRTNDLTGNTYDLWYGNIDLRRVTVTTPNNPAPGGASRLPALNTWTNSLSQPSGGHNDCGDMIFDPTVTIDACPILFSNDGGVYFNTATGAACQTVAWEQPTVSPHGLWPFSMAGVNQPGNPAEDLYFMNQDNGTFATTNAAAAAPNWVNQNCCDGFDVGAGNNDVLYTLCCFNGNASLRRNRVFLANQGLGAPAQINTYPADGLVGGFRFPDVLARFANNSYVLLTTDCGPNFANGVDDDGDGFVDEIDETGGGCSGTNFGDGGVYITTNITANPIVWTELGPLTEGNISANACGVYVGVTGGTPTFYVQVGNCSGNGMDQIWSYTGTAANNAWQQVNPPGGLGGFGIFTADPGNPNRLMASHLRPGMDPQMIISTNGGANWTPMPSLDQQMDGNDTFQNTTAVGPTNFTNFGGYVQPSLVAFHPQNANVLVAGAMDAGLFVSNDGGICWTRITDPATPHISGIPHITRPKYAYFSDQPDQGGLNVTDLYIGAQGRGVWRVQLTYPDPPATTVTQILTPPTCPGFCDGSIDITPAGGNPPYAFNWSTGATTEDVSGLCADDYSVTISDRDGCIVQSFTLPDGVDNTPPQITCQPPMDLSCELPSEPDAIGRPVATDDCGLGSMTHSDVIVPGSCPQEFTINRTWTVFDINGNQNSCTQVISVIDTTPPVLIVPADAVVTCDTSAATGTGMATATDNCSTSIGIWYSDQVTDGDCDWLCFIERTWRAIDECGNKISVVQNIEKNTLPLILDALAADLDGDGLTDTLIMGQTNTNLKIGAGTKAAECVLKMLPGTGGSPSGLKRGQQEVDQDCLPGNNPVDGDGKLRNPLLAEGLKLSIILRLDPDFNNVKIADLPCDFSDGVDHNLSNNADIREFHRLVQIALAGLTLQPNLEELLQAILCVNAPLNVCDAANN